MLCSYCAQRCLDAKQAHSEGASLGYRTSRRGEKIHLVHSEFVFTDPVPLNYFLMVCVEKKFLYAHLRI